MMSTNPSGISTPTEPPASPNGSEATKMDPSSYFPSSHRSSFSSSASVLPEFDATPQALAEAARTGAVAATGPGNTKNPVDTLSRTFPKPTGEPSLDEMLERPPPKWSVGYYVKHARETKVPVVSKEDQAKAFAETKRGLLQASKELKTHHSGRR